MVVFITDKKHNVTDVPDSLVTLSGTEGLQHIRTYWQNNSITTFGLDTENTDLDAYRAKPLLLSLGTEEVQFVIDMVSVNPTELLREMNQEVTWILQNAKYDYSVLKVQIGLELNKMYDTMIVEQRLYANMFDPKDKPFRLDHIVRRNLGYIPPTMLKEIRNEFAGVNPASFIFENRHIFYSAGDVPQLFPLKKVQEARIKQYKLEFLINEIEFPLIRVLGDAEIEGLDLDVKKLKEIVEENIKEKFNKEKELDEEVRALRDAYHCEGEDTRFLIGGKYDRERKEKQKLTQGTLLNLNEIPKLDKAVKRKAKPKVVSAYINYGSTKEIINIIGRLGFPVPNKKGDYVVPIFDEEGSLKNVAEEFTTGEAAIEQYLIDNPGTPLRTFLKTLIDYREICTELSKYGLDFANKVNSLSGRIHTTYRQTAAVNGRLQSGGGKENQSDKINIQNIPRKKKFRNLFYREGYSIVTCDLSGAEAIILADKANDMRLYELSKADIHSYMAQKGWRNIYKYRSLMAASEAREIIDKNRDRSKLPQLKEVYETNRKAAEEFIVTKLLNNESHRQPCKNLTYGGFYGVHDKKAAKTINCSRAEGRIYLDTLRAEFGKTFSLVDTNARFAISNGYIVFNDRTNSRIWFPAVISAIRTGSDLQFRDEHETDTQARNTPISGTQADMVKEAMVEIDRAIKNQGIDAGLLIQVHDELVYRFKPGILVRYYEDPKTVIKPIGHSDIIRFNNFIDANQGRLVTFPEFVKLTMCKCANRYLRHIEMEAEIQVENYWTK